MPIAGKVAAPMEALRMVARGAQLVWAAALRAAAIGLAALGAAAKTVREAAAQAVGARVVTEARVVEMVERAETVVDVVASVAV